jgi:hypothetical protein
MDFHGHINLNNNEMQKMVLKNENDFPVTPKVGRIIFKSKRVWICVDISGTPAWVPLTTLTNTYIHDQETSSASWTVTHNLVTQTPVVQVFSWDGMEMFIPNSIEPTSDNALTITFGTAVQGRAVVMFGEPTVYPI